MTRKNKDLEENMKEVDDAMNFKLEDLEGIGTVRLKKLNDAGIYTAEDLTVRGEKEIQGLLEITYDDAKKLIRKAMDALQDRNVVGKTIITADEFQEYRDARIEFLTTGLEEFDEILGGGYETGVLTEFFGEFGSGKTQFCTVACIMAQLPKKMCCLKCGKEPEQDGDTCVLPECGGKIWYGGGLSEFGKPCRVIYIDTENSFRPERLSGIICNRDLVETKPQTKTEIKQKAQKIPLNIEEEEKVRTFRKNISYIRPRTSAHQMMIAENLVSIIKGDLCKICGNREMSAENKPTHITKDIKDDGLEQHEFEGMEPARLVIIDSIIHEFRSDFDGRGELSERQRLINKHIKHVSRTVETMNVTCIITNQIMHAPSAIGDPIRVIGGNVIAHTSTHRIYLKKPQSFTKNKITVILIDSPNHAKNEVVLELGNKGIQEIE